MVARPALAPVTVPFTTVAAVLLLVHAPPVVASVSTAVVAIQMLTGVEGLMAAGSAFTVTLAVVIHVPILYVIMAVPALAPVTVPLITVAAVLLLVHVPPLVASVRWVVLPAQMLLFSGLIATGAVLTVTGLVT
jgi:hypothetical protein